MSLELVDGLLLQVISGDPTTGGRVTDRRKNSVPRQGEITCLNFETGRNAKVVSFFLGIFDISDF